MLAFWIPRLLKRKRFWESEMLKTLGTIVVCWWAADFLTGFFHWLEDTYCLEGMPLIGSFICEPNIEHHIGPEVPQSW